MTTFTDIFAVCAWLRVTVRYESWGDVVHPNNAMGEPPLLTGVCWCRDAEGVSYISVNTDDDPRTEDIVGSVGHELAHLLVGVVTTKGAVGDIVEAAVLVVEHSLIRMLEPKAQKVHIAHYEDYGWHWYGEPDIVPFGRETAVLRTWGTIDDFWAFPATNSWRFAVKELHKIWYGR